MFACRFILLYRSRYNSAMVRFFITLFIVAVIARFLYWATLSIIAWLGRGKRLHHAAQDGTLSPTTAEQVLLIEQFRQYAKEEEARTGQRVPRLSRAQVHEVMELRAQERERFLDNLHIGFYHVVMVFFIGSILGLFLEEAWMYITAGLTESRVGLVWGPFSPIYGIGAALLTMLTFALRRKNAPLWVVFLLSVVVGGGLEQFAGWAMEVLFHAQSWDYSGVPGAITQWVAWPFLGFWGILGTIWYRSIMPELLYRLGVPTTRRQAIVFSLLVVYLAADIFMTFACFDRVTERHEGIPPANEFERWIDTHYTDQWVEGRFENLSIEEAE